jgi:hypothetical protein
VQLTVERMPRIEDSKGDRQAVLTEGGNVAEVGTDGPSIPKIMMTDRIALEARVVRMLAANDLDPQRLQGRPD